MAYKVNRSDLEAGDEVKKVRTRVPRSMIIACTVNSAMLIVFATILLFYMGPLDDVLDTPLPLLWIIYSITGSKVAANVLISLIAIIFFLALFNIFASVSRLVWVFARDNGLPFSSFFAYVGAVITSGRRMLMFCTGTSYASAPRERFTPGRNHRHLPLPYLHRQRDRVQRANLTSSSCPTRVVLLPDPLHLASEASRPDSTFRAVQDGRSRSANQYLRIVLFGLRGALDAFPTDFAGHERQHELCWAYFWSCSPGCIGTLVSSCEEDVQNADHKLRVTSSGYFQEEFREGTWLVRRFRLRQPLR